MGHSPIKTLYSLLAPRGLPPIAVLSFNVQGVGSRRKLAGWLQFASANSQTSSRAKHQATYGFSWQGNTLRLQRVRTATQAPPPRCVFYLQAPKSAKLKKNPEQDSRLGLRVTVRGVQVEKALRVMLRALPSTDLPETGPPKTGPSETPISVVLPKVGLRSQSPPS